MLDFREELEEVKKLHKDRKRATEFLKNLITYLKRMDSEKFSGIETLKFQKYQSKEGLMIIDNNGCLLYEEETESAAVVFDYVKDIVRASCREFFADGVDYFIVKLSSI